MPEFTFTARDESGARQTGVIEAGSSSNVADQIRSRGWLVVSVEENVSEAGIFQGGSSFQLPFTGVRKIDVELALRQLAVMLKGGLTLLSSLNVLAVNSPRRSSRKMWAEVIEDIQSGESFAEAIESQDGIPGFVSRLVNVGEQTGILDSVLIQAADMIKARRALVRDLMTALAYPAIVFVISILIATYLVLVIIPQLGEFLGKMGKELPWITQLLLDVADFIQVWGGPIFVTILVATIGFTAVYLTETGRILIDRIALRIPIIGPIFRLSGTTTFSQSLSILVSSGVTVIDSLRTVETMHYNQYFALCVREARESVMNGRTLASAIGERNAYLPLLTSMTAVAEQSGNLDEVMEDVAVFHGDLLKSKIQTLSAWLAPCVILVVGTIVGFVYIAFIVALFAVAAP